MGAGNMHGVPVLLCKPMTFMNVSGESVAPIMKDNGLELSQVQLSSNVACQQPDKRAVASAQANHRQNSKQHPDASHTPKQGLC